MSKLKGGVPQTEGLDLSDLGPPPASDAAAQMSFRKEHHRTAAVSETKLRMLISLRMTSSSKLEEGSRNCRT
jgi:hypothetical protein